MVSKNLNEIIREIKIEDAELINQKEIESFSLERLQELKEKKLNNKIESEIKVSKVETEIKDEIKEEAKNEIKEEAKNEIKEESKNEIIINQKEEKEEKEEEEPKEKNQTKKKKNKKKKKKTNKIFEVPQTNPYRNLFDFKDVSKSRFQDNSIFRVINNWEEKEWFQTNPPTKDIDEQFTNQVFPQGEIQPYLK